MHVGYIRYMSYVSHLTIFMNRLRSLEMATNLSFFVFKKFEMFLEWKTLVVKTKILRENILKITDF